MLNLFFMFFNLPIIFFLIFIGAKNIFNYFPLFLLTLIPVMPVFTSLLYCMGILIDKKDLNLFKDFFHGLKINFVQALLLWCFQLGFIFMLYCNINYFYKCSFVFTVFFSSIIIITFAMTPYIYLLISTFSINTLNIIKNSFILTFTCPLLTFTNILCVLSLLILFIIFSGTTVLFIASILAFLIRFSNKSLINKLKTVPVIKD